MVGIDKKDRGDKTNNDYDKYAKEKHKKFAKIVIFSIVLAKCFFVCIIISVKRLRLYSRE